MKHTYSRQETSKLYGGYIVFYPQTSTGSALPGVASAELYDPSNTSLGSAAVVWEDKKIVVSIPALSAGDDHSCEITYAISGSSLYQTRRIPFDVVHSPWSAEVLCSYEDLIQQHSDIQPILAKQAATDGITAQEKAYDFINLAHIEIDGWIRQRSITDGSIRARAIFERDLLHYTEARLAASKVFQSITPGTDDHPTENKRKMFYVDALNHFRSLQFRYDRDEDGSPDAELPQMGVNITLRRR